MQFRISKLNLIYKFDFTSLWDNLPEIPPLCILPATRVVFLQQINTTNFQEPQKGGDLGFAQKSAVMEAEIARPVLSSLH